MNRSLLSRFGHPFAAVAFGLIVIAGFGCASEQEASSSENWAERVRSNMTPELQSLAMTEEQRKNVHAYTKETNLRQVWDDLDYMLLIDRPVRFSRYPIP